MAVFTTYQSLFLFKATVIIIIIKNKSNVDDNQNDGWLVNAELMTMLKIKIGWVFPKDQTEQKKKKKYC